MTQPALVLSSPTCPIRTVRSDRERLVVVDEAILWARLAATACVASRDALVERYCPLARRIATDHCRVGSPRHGDVQSAAYLGLVKAVARFRPERGNSFAVYARLVIRGEVLRHIRGTRYSAHVPRPQHERYMAVRTASRRAAVELGREPSVRDLAERLGWGVEEVLSALDTERAESPTTLDGLGAARRSDDDVADAASTRVLAARAVRGLDDRQRHIVTRHFRDDATQSEIAAELQVSQAHVSRLLRRAIDQMRHELTSPAA